MVHHKGRKVGATPIRSTAQNPNKSGVQLLAKYLLTRQNPRTDFPNRGGKPRIPDSLWKVVEPGAGGTMRTKTEIHHLLSGQNIQRTELRQAVQSQMQYC